MSWGEFLGYATNTLGIGVIVGIVLSVIVEYVPQYMRLEARWKRAIFMGLCFAIPLVATALAVITGIHDNWLDWELVWWPAVQAGFVAGTAGTLVHIRKL